MEKNIYCAWTNCKYCKDVQGIQGKCTHINGTQWLKDNDKIKLVHDSVMNCSMYSRMEE